MRNIGALFITIGCLMVPAVSSALTMGNHLCKDKEHYTCYTVKKLDSWKSLFSDSDVRDRVMRVNRINNALYRGQRIAIPKNIHIGLNAIAPFPQRIYPLKTKLIVVSINPKMLAWGAYDLNGDLVRWGPAVGGRGYCPDIKRKCTTTLGTYFIYRKQGGNCVSTKYPVGKGGAPMPWCMFFNGGYALHGSNDVPGYNASHGCIRLFVQDAQWLNQNFVSDNLVSVIITNKADGF